MAYYDKKKAKRKVILLVIILIFMAVWGWYINDYYHAEHPKIAIQSTDQVKVSRTGTGYLYDGPGEDTALIFYPGAKVEDRAYAPLLKELAGQGVDCYLVHMPANLAMFGINRADKVMRQGSYQHWYLAGHSLGGAMAAVYADKNSDKLDGLIFLAAYTTKDLSDTNLKVLSLYGSKDGVVNRDKIAEGRKLVPESYTEYCIPGGNHAQFGEYGKQKGDGSAEISEEKQREIAAQKILDFMKEDASNEK